MSGGTQRGRSVVVDGRAWAGARPWPADDGGQAAVELVGLVPLLAAIVLAIAGFLAGHAAREAADQAAVAAAIAQLQGNDPAMAAKAASPGWTKTEVKVTRARATVRIVPRVPRFVARQIDAERSVVFDAVAAR